MRLNVCFFEEEGGIVKMGERKIRRDAERGRGTLSDVRRGKRKARKAV